MSRPKSRLSPVRCLLALATLAAGTAPAVAQSGGAPPPAAARLEIRGDSLRTRIFTAAQIAAMPHVQVRATEHGHTGDFSGVPLDTLLRRAGVPVDSVRGRRTADYVLAVAADGYRSVFSLAEVAPDLGGRGVLVADRRDGHPLAAGEGPLRLVVPDDKRPTRWVRQLSTLVIRRAQP